MENGIVCANDYISIEFNIDNSSLVNLRCNWTYNVTFPSPQNIITKDKAKDFFLQKYKPELMYVVNEKSKNETKLIYAQDILAYVDALTGKVYTYSFDNNNN